MKELLKKVTEGQNLTREEAAKAMDMMLEGTASPVLVSAFLTALRMKGETIDEIVGCTEMMKSKGGSGKLDTDEYIDFVGTGGDGANSFNISTTSMFVCAAAGVTVAKHGNRAASSKSGASDLLEALGANIMLEPNHQPHTKKHTQKKYKPVVYFIGYIHISFHWFIFYSSFIRTATQFPDISSASTQPYGSLAQKESLL